MAKYNSKSDPEIMHALLNGTPTAEVTQMRLNKEQLERENRQEISLFKAAATGLATGAAYKFLFGNRG